MTAVTDVPVKKAWKIQTWLSFIVSASPSTHDIRNRSARKRKNRLLIPFMYSSDYITERKIK